LYNQKTAVLEPPMLQAVEEEPLLRERVLRASIAPLDDLVDGFRSSKVTLLDSDSSYASTLLHMLCVRAISEFDEEVVWVDGGNEVNPYAISSICKRLLLDKRDILSRVNLSRAFTAYQLVTLIDEKLEEQVRKCSPSMIIVSSIAELFLDKDMKWMESHQLLRRCADDISRITKDYEAIAVVSNAAYHHVRPSPGLTALLYECSDIALQIRTRRNGLLLRVPNKDRETLFSPVPWNQSTMDEFRGDSDGKDGAYIPLGP
jgi:hypothetical protein